MKTYRTTSICATALAFIGASSTALALPTVPDNGPTAPLLAVALVGVFAAFRFLGKRK